MYGNGEGEFSGDVTEMHKWMLNGVGLHNERFVLSAGPALTMRPVRLEPHQYFRFTNRGHFFKSPKNAIKSNQKKYTPLEPHHYFRVCAATVKKGVNTKLISSLFR